MSSIHVNSPANGSSVPANSAVSVSVSWDAGSSVRSDPETRSKKKKGSSSAVTKAYTITCSGAPNFDTDDPNDTTTFSIQSGPSGSSKIVMVALLKNSTTGGTIGLPLASASVTIHSQGAGTLPGTIGLPPPLPPVPFASKAHHSSSKKYVCGTYAASVSYLICVTYRVEVDQAVPRDGKSGSPEFTLSNKLKKVKQYSLHAGNLAMAGGKWQATVKSDLTDPDDGYQIQVWFLDANWVVLGTGSTALAPVAQSTPCT